jgi:hypothetical protein
MAKDVAACAAGLNAALERSSLTVSLGAGNESDIAKAKEVLPLTDSMIEWYRCASPLEFEIPWTFEWLMLYGPGNLMDGQAGYRWISGVEEELIEEWNADWVVIGDCSADPVIADTSKPETPIFTAMHGCGSWEPELIAPNLGAYLQILSHWVDALTENEGRIEDEHGEFLSGFLDSLKARLSGSTPDVCIDNLFGHLWTE